GLLGTSDTTSRLQRRLAMIRDYRGRSRRATVVAVVTIALACCMGLTNPPAADTTGAAEALRETNTTASTQPRGEEITEVEAKASDTDAARASGEPAN